MPRRRRAGIVLSAAVVVFWLVMMGLLLQREYFVERAGPGTAGGRAERYDTWMAIYADEEESARVGFIHSQAKPEVRNGNTGTAYNVTVKFAADLLEMPTEMLVTGNAFALEGAGLSEFDFRIRSFEHVLRVMGAVRNGQINLDIVTAGETFPLSLPVSDNLMLQGNMGTTTLNLPALEVGDEVLVDAFDPMTLSTGTARIKCIDTETIEVLGEQTATRVITARHGGIETTFWVTGDEEIVRIRSPFGFVFKKTSQDEAMAGLEPSETKDLLDKLAVRPKGEIPFRGATRLKLRLDKLPEESLPPSDDMQRALGGGIYEIVQPEPSRIEADPPNAQDYLESDPFVQADHERIVDQAQEIVGDANDRWTKAMRLYDWVFDNIEKTIVLSFPSALDVLESRQGDCNEHTVLYTALARSVGVPTRIAVGVVWSDELRGFYYHAWPEVYMDRWIAIDPTLGQRYADATHLKLLTGSIEKWPQLVPYLGQLEIEILEVE